LSEVTKKEASGATILGLQDRKIKKTGNPSGKGHPWDFKTKTERLSENSGNEFLPFG